MKKRLISVTAAWLLLCPVMGCSGGSVSTPPQGGDSVVRSTKSEVTQGASIPGASKDRVVAREMSTLSKTSGETQRDRGTYVKEVESANCLVAQNKASYSRSAPGRRGYTVSQTGTQEKTADAETADFKAAIIDPLSTFSADVDTASYSNLRRSLNEGRMPDPSEVRVEEMINYFTYQLPEPKAGQPFSLTSEVSDCPWNESAQLLRIAIKTKSIDREQKPPCNLVFLLDVSGSMQSADKLPLLKSSLKTMVDSLDDGDRIAIVTYAGSSGLVLPSTPASEKSTILAAIDRLEAGGSTNGASGIELAYQVAAQNEGEDSVNRVILATDGDFNVGVSSQDGLKTLIEEKRRSGIFLSVLGFGSTGKDKVMETLADNGNGNYASIDSLSEARKVLVEESGANLVTVAKDVKFQVDFNPKKVGRYRLLGYKNRRLANADFANDKKDAGDLGAGHAVTALYEVIPAEGTAESLKDAFLLATGMSASPLATVKLRYKAPSDDESTLIQVPIEPAHKPLAQASSDHRWAVAVTSLGLSLDGDSAGAEISMDQVTSMAQEAAGTSPDSYREEFLQMVKRAKEVST